jgi:glucose/mannose transport system substrate-binding protein
MKVSSPILISAVLSLLSFPVSSHGAGTKQVEIFSWWTSGGEAAALDALFSQYKKANPGVEIVNAAIAGGSGSAARAVLQTRLAGGDPPDSWSAQPGAQLKQQYVEPGFCEPITEIYDSQGWRKVIPAALLDLITKDGKIYGVMVGVHRANDLWYNKQLLQKYGITVGPKMTFDEFFAAADKLRAAGVSALAVGDTNIWAATQLFENVLLGVVGGQGWKDLFSGKMRSCAFSV